MFFGAGMAEEPTKILPVLIMVGTVAAPRHICVDHAAARRLLAGPLAPGRPIDLLHHVDGPSRVKIA